jgi:trans-aconitate 2-methyltransferase
MAKWDEAQYLKFGGERTRAALELLLRVPMSAAARVTDLGCGTGNSTALLRERWPAAHVIGIDSSDEMLRKARADAPTVEWILADLRDYRPAEPVDVLFSNAVMHWVPDHAKLFPLLFEWVRPGGALAVQMPHNFDEPSHRAMREVEGPWKERLRKVRALTPAAGPAFYYDLLAPNASVVDIWETRYEHVMRDAADIVEWVKGTGLRPYLEALADEDERTAYLHAYTQAIDAAYPSRIDGKRLFSFPRLFIVAVRHS